MGSNWGSTLGWRSQLGRRSEGSRSTIHRSHKEGIGDTQTRDMLQVHLPRACQTPIQKCILTLKLRLSWKETHFWDSGVRDPWGSSTAGSHRAFVSSRKWHSFLKTPSLYLSEHCQTYDDCSLKGTPSCCVINHMWNHCGYRGQLWVGGRGLAGTYLWMSNGGRIAYLL